METLKGQGASYIEPEKEKKKKKTELFSNRYRENVKIEYEQITTIIKYLSLKGNISSEACNSTGSHYKFVSQLMTYEYIKNIQHI